MPNNEKIRVGIVFGGQSAEHDFDFVCAQRPAALDRSRFEPVLIGIDKAGRWLKQDAQKLLASEQDPRLVAIQAGLPVQVAPRMTVAMPNSSPGASQIVDVLFPVLHGTLGEDGAMQGLFEVAAIPYVGAGVLGSAIGMDKDVMKRLLREALVPVTPFRTLRHDHFEADPQQACHELLPLGFPLFTKPANAGSSVGVRKVKSAAELTEAIRYAFQFDSKVIAEAAVVGREIELAVLGGHPPTVTVAGEIIVDHPDGFYSYDAKYIDDGARLEIPAKLSADALRRAQSLALQAFEVLECEGMARVDMFLKDDGSLLINEINTIPGFTAISMYPKLWAASGVPPTQLVSRLIELALARGERRAAIRRSIAS